MLTRLPTVTARTMLRFLESLGFEEIRSRGSHHFFRHPDGRTATIPVHAGEDLGRGVTSKILNDAEVDRAVFITWLYE
ncbi:MAG TPA: type II toxin-antitoxin system HicA family toxin [bacterium]|nr:type II toxin-antitoxin system HicA family toxin [bacterium]